MDSFLRVYFLWREIIKGQLINYQIRAEKVQVISNTGEKLGIMNTKKAIELAEDEGLDLVLVSPNGDVPVTKIMDYGKYAFEKSKREKESRRNSKALELKELRISPNIAENDLGFKTKNARKFLVDGHNVKLTMRFRGREIVKSDLGKQLLESVAKQLEDIADVTKKPSIEGRSMFMILSKKK